MYRNASVSGREMTSRGVEELNIRATTTQGVIRILQERLDVIMPQFGASIRTDDETERITDALIAKLREEQEALVSSILKNDNLCFTPLARRGLGCQAGYIPRA